MSGGLYGGQVGCDFQMGGSLVFGIEGSISGTSLDDTKVDPLNPAWMLQARHDWLAALSGRVGIGAGNALIYGRAGIAWADSKLQIQNNGIFDGDVSKRRQGWVFGGGIEYAFSPTWSMFVEGDYYKFGDTDLAFAGDLINPRPAFTVRSKETIQAVKVGLNYRFGNIFGGGF
jgi:outer membrane immunogenic protein